MNQKRRNIKNGRAFSNRKMIGLLRKLENHEFETKEEIFVYLKLDYNNPIDKTFFYSFMNNILKTKTYKDISMKFDLDKCKAGYHFATSKYSFSRAPRLEEGEVINIINMKNKGYNCIDIAKLYGFIQATSIYDIISGKSYSSFSAKLFKD